MNKKIGVIASVINVIAVLGFAVSMPFSFDFGSYFSSMFIAFSFVPMMCAYAHFGNSKTKIAGLSSIVFAAIYAAFILLVYFTQLTLVRFGGISEEISAIFDYKKFGLFFNLDLLGYGLMALSTFFAGFTVKVKSKADKWLKSLLMIHGVFFLSCLIMPLLNIFQSGGEEWIGVAVLEFWCIYFIPIGILSVLHFSKYKE